MTMMDYFVMNTIWVDFATDPMYGDDQTFVSYPHRFATVTFELLDTESLTQIADKIRTETGYPPLIPFGDWNEDSCDQNGWYKFYIGLNDYSVTKMDTCIWFVVENSDEDDRETVYMIPLSTEEQRAIFYQLNLQCIKQLEKNCLDLLEEAKNEMEGK